MANLPLPPDPELDKVARLWQDATDTQGTSKAPSTLVSWTSDTAVPGLNSPAPPPPLSPSAASKLPGSSPSISITPPSGMAALSRQLEALKQAKPVVPPPPAKPPRGMAEIAIVILIVGCAGVAIWLGSPRGQTPAASEPTPHPAVTSDKVLSAGEAFDHVGENARVEFKVREFSFSAGESQTLYVSACEGQAKGGQFRLVVSAEVVTELVARKRLNPNGLEGRTVRVRGAIERDGANVQINVSNGNQFEKLPKN